jgi:hypothetical protein
MGFEALVQDNITSLDPESAMIAGLFIAAGDDDCGIAVIVAVAAKN